MLTVKSLGPTLFCPVLTIQTSWQVNYFPIEELRVSLCVFILVSERKIILKMVWGGFYLFWAISKYAQILHLLFCASLSLKGFVCYKSWGFSTLFLS